MDPAGNAHFQISTKSQLLKKQKVVKYILSLQMIKQPISNNLSSPDLQKMCFWRRYKGLKKSMETFSREWDIFAGINLHGVIEQDDIQILLYINLGKSQNKIVGIDFF